MSFLADYEPVEDRLRQFWQDNPYGRVITELLPERHDGEYIVFASVYRGNELRNDPPCATGLASEYAGTTGVNKTSALENCETSAIGRALANMGYAPKGKRPSREEMSKTTSPTTAQPTASKPQSRLGDGAVTSHEAPTGGGAAVSVAVVTDLGSAADSNASQTTGKVSNSAGETPADPVPLPVVTDVPEKLASDEQWRRLLDVCDQSKQRAVNKINKANGTHYTIATATEGATWAELVKAMT